MSKIKNIIFFFLFISFSAFAQDETKCQEIDNKKAVKAYEEGINKKNKKDERLAALKQAIALEPDYVDANFAFAMERIKTLIYENAAFKPTEPYFKKVVEICPKYHSNPYYYLGFIYYEDENWKESAKYLKSFLDFKDDDINKYDKNYDAFLSQAKQMYRHAKFYNEVMNNPVPFDPSIVQGICTDKDEYLPLISPDDETMYFIRREPYVNKDMVFQSDKELELFSLSKRNKTTGLFEKGKRMSYPFNQSGGGQGAASISIDNRHLYFTLCKDEGGAQINCDIYFCSYINGEWTDIKKVEGINDPVYWDSQPSVSADGNTLYFASDRKGGRGGVDIYKSAKDPKTGVWGKVENMGPVINTPYDEKSPFMHSDSETMYFSSDGHTGVGGFDIFLARKNEKGEWNEPKNIGIPINTKGDDLGFIVSTDGHLAYFASNEPSRTKGKSVGKYDIFSFELYKEARPDEVAFIKGKVEDKSPNPAKKAFTVEVKDAETKKVTKAIVDTITGEYAVMVNMKKKSDLIVTVKKDNNAFSSQMVAKEALVNAKPVKMNIETNPIEIGKTYTLNNIYYKTNSSSLEPKSMTVIEEFVEFLKANPKLKIEIHGHTDNKGDANSNLALSTDRAFTVRDILVEKGIEEKRLVAFKGFGASKPVADNATEEGRSKNRRTEFVIVSK